MPNLMQRGATWLGEKLQAAAGRTVTIRFGRTLSDPITAWVANMEHQEVGDDGLVTSILSDDWTFVASEYAVGSDTEPRPGHIISETLNGVDIEYEVLPPTNDQERCFKWLDTSGELILVHTKRIS